MALQIKVKFNGVDNVAIDDCAGGAISAPIALVVIAREEANVVTLANNDKRDGGVETQFFACACGGNENYKYERYIWRVHTSDEG